MVTKSVGRKKEEVEDDSKCPVCRDSQVIYDYESGELYCPQCGICIS